MKRCPECNRTYSDDRFSFCLADGALLSAPFDPDATLVISAPSNAKTSEVELEQQGVTSVKMLRQTFWMNEGTILKWRKKVGEHVERDEPLADVLFEDLSPNEKFISQILSHCSGVLLKILVEEGQTVPADTEIAQIIYRWIARIKPY